MATQGVRFGVYLPPFGPFGDARALVQLATHAEAAGWDGVFLWDHVLAEEGLPVADPWVALGGMGQATQRILLGTTVTPLARRRPWVVARHTATLSGLTAGRIVLGVGLGSDETGDFSAFGEVLDPHARAACLDEGLEIVQAMWSGREHRSGVRYQVDIPAGVPIEHEIPIWIANTPPGRRSLRRAVRHDGLFPNNPVDGVSAEDLTSIRAELRALGLPDDRKFDLILSGNASSAWPDESTVDLPALAEAGMTWWMESFIHHDPWELSLAVIDAGPPRP